MKKILFVMLIAVVFVLASCTLAPFAYLFGGGMVSGGGHSSSNREVELKLNFSNYEESFDDLLSYYVVEIKGDADIFDGNVPKDVQVKQYKLESGQYSIRVRGMQFDGKMLGIYNKNIVLDGTKEKTLELDVDLNRTVTLNISFEGAGIPTTQQMNSRFIDDRTRNIKLFVRTGTDGQGDEVTAKQETTLGSSVTFTVDVETGNNYTFEAYTQVTGLKPGSGNSQLEVATQTLGYGATMVSIGPVQNYNVVIDVNNFSATATQDDVATGSSVKPIVEIMFPENYREYRMPNLPTTTNPIPETNWGNVSLYYIKSDNITDAATEHNVRDNGTVYYYPGSEKAEFYHTTGIFLAGGEYYYWFSATDTNNVWFHFPLTAIDNSGVIENDPVNFTVYENAEGSVVVQ